MRTLLLLLVLVPAVASAADDPRRTPIVVAVERAAPAVVTIDVEVPVASPFLAWGERTAQSQGSGVILDGDGVVLTNAHVVEGASAVTVHTQDGRAFPARIVAGDGDLDLAVLRLEGAHGLPEIAVGDSGDLLLGEPAIAIGNPYGLGLTVSTGVVASIRREVTVREGVTQDYIQTDAAINPGNSGGALVDVHGRLIGINTFIHQSAEGIGFAIPVNRAQKVASDLLAYGSVRIPWLGLDLQDLGNRRFQGTLLEHGAMRVTGVAPGGPAEAAGVKIGDLVYQVDGRPTGSRADMNVYLSSRNPGERLRLGMVRGGNQVGELTLTSSTPPADLGARSLKDAIAVDVRDGEGVVDVIRVGTYGGWARARLAVGDRIVAVDGERVTDTASLLQALGRAKARHRPTAWFTVQRGRVQGTVEVEI